MNDKEPQYEHSTTYDLYDMIRKRLIGSLALVTPASESKKNKDKKKKKK